MTNSGRRLRPYEVLAVLLTSALVLGACSSSPRARADRAVTTTTSTASTTSTAASPTTTRTTVPAGPRGGPVPSGFQVESVTFVSSGQGFVLGTAGCNTGTCAAVLRTRDAGHTWAGIPAPVVTVGTGSGRVGGIRFADALDGWIFGPDHLSSTHDGGSHWQTVSVPGGGSIQSFEAGGGSAYALVIAGNGANPAPAALYSTPVGSDRWAQVAGTSVPNAVSGRVVVHGSSVWTVVQTAGGPSVFRASGPSGWVARPLPCQGPSGDAVAAADSSDMSVVCASGAAAGQQPKLAYLSHDGGVSWSAAGNAPQSGDTLAVAMASPSTLVISAASGASLLYASFDGGRTWSTVEEDSAGGGLPWSDLGFTDSQQGVVVEGQLGVSGTATHLYATRDGGHSWSPVAFTG